MEWFSMFASVAYYLIPHGQNALSSWRHYKTLYRESIRRLGNFPRTLSGSVLDPSSDGKILSCCSDIQSENVIGDLMVDYRDDNIVEQGFVFKRISTGVVCGCGESFTPLGSNKKLGWDV